MIRTLRISFVVELVLALTVAVAHAQTPAKPAAAKPAAAAPAPAPPAAPITAPVAAVTPAATTTPAVTTSPAAEAPVAAAPETPAPTPETPPAPSANSEDTDLPDAQLLVLDPKAKEDLEQRLKSLDSAGLSDDDKAKAVAFYQQAIESFDIAVQQAAAAVAFQKQLDALPAETNAYSTRLAKPLPSAEDVTGEALSAVEERAAKAEASLAHCRQELAAMIAEPKRRAQRISEMPKQIAESQQRLKELTAELDTLGSEEVSDVVTIARRAALLQAKSATMSTIQSLDREQRLYADGAQLIKLRRDYYARYVPHKEKRLTLLFNQISERRQNEAASQVAAAAKAVEEASPKVVSLAQENKELAERRTQVVAALNAIGKELGASKAALRDLNEKFTKAVEQDKVDELAAVNGQLLREQQAKLPNLRALRRHRVQREGQIASALLEQFQLIDQQSQLSNINDLADKLAAEAGDLSDATRNKIRELLEGKRAILEQLVDNFNDYSDKLAKIQTNETQLIAETERYASFIAERVLWIRSCQPLSRSDWLPAVDAAKWSLNPANWNDAGRAMVQAVKTKPGQVTLIALGLIVTLVAQRPARRRLRELGEEAAKRGCIRLRPTFDALWLTIVLALPGPTLLACLGWTMDSLSSSEFVRSLSASLRFTAICWLLIELTRHLCRRGGLADAHFDWSEACLHHLRRRMNWLALFSLPLVLWLVGLDTQQQDPTTISSHWSSSLGRVLFIGVMLLLAKFLHRILLAKKSPFRQVNFIGGGWLTPLKIVWRPAVTFLPATLAVMAAVGYYYTALQSAVRILETVAMLLAVGTLGGLTRRWLLVNRRRLAREQAKQRRAQLLAAVETDSSDPLTPEVADDTVDLAALSEQTQTLVRTFLGFMTAVGLVFIWGAILPALAYPASHKLPGAEVLTWGHLASFLIVLAVTFVSVRDIPALLELAILQHLPLDGGARYAFTSISRYVLTAVGLIAAFNCIGGDWSKVQWLVAAMSVGLGFGLQEIFANFVSGIILLFERPIRVGDIVTLGDKSGVVNRIRMRATTIIDWEKKEYIVPNKDLMTDRLLNWTLSDHINRIGVSIGVAYDSDVEGACQLLLEAAREQPHIMSDPPPVAFFEAFGDSALQLKLFCHLPNLENRTSTIHQLNTTIARKFKEAGLDIPFPQRDLNVRFDREKFSIDLEGKNFLVGQLPTRPSVVGQPKGSSQQGAA